MMKGFKNLFGVLPLIYILTFFTSCGEVEGININMEIPVTVGEQDQFETEIEITNTLNQSQDLISIDIGDDYLDGIALIKTYPNYTDQIHIPIDNTISYKFGQTIGPKESITIHLYWQAINAGDWHDEIDFCINHDYTYISRTARTKVLPGGN